MDAELPRTAVAASGAGVATAPDPSGPDGGDGGTTPTGAPAPQGIGYQPALDGMRAFAVVAVLLYHGGVGWATGGFLGVDAFFVLSGFLITSLLVTELGAHGRVDFREFFTRRSRRLLPAIIVLVAAIAVYAYWFAPDSQVRSLPGDSLATTLYYANWRQVLSPAGYFDLFTTPSPLRHTWSLAVEEQWYIVWPFALFGIAALCRGRVRHMFFVVAGLAVAGAVWTAWLAHPGQDPSRVYYGTDTRAHELLVGAALALLVTWAAQRWSRWSDSRPTTGDRILHAAALVAVVVTIACWSQVDGRSSWLYEGGLLALAVAIALIIASSLRPGSPVGRFLSWRPFVMVGLISYALYLWHWPVYLVLDQQRTGLEGTGLLVLRLAVSVVLAVASYLLIERPFRRRALHGWRLVGVLAVAAAAALGLVVAATLAADPAPPEPARRPAAPIAGVPTSFIMGDSVALNLGWGLEETGAGRANFVGNTWLGCGLLSGRIVDDPRPNAVDATNECPAWLRRVQADLETRRPDQVTMLPSIWDSYDRTWRGRTYRFGTRTWDRMYEANLQARIDEVPAGVRSIVLYTSPCYDASATEGEFHKGAHLFAAADRRHVDDLTRAVAQRNAPRVALVDLGAIVCPGGRYQAADGDVVLRVDGIHFSAEGARRVGAALAPVLLDTLAATPVPTSVPGPSPSTAPGG